MPTDLNAFSMALAGLGAAMALAVIAWLISLWRRDVSIIDSFWSLLICAAGLTYVTLAGTDTVRSRMMIALALLWALRLAVYLTWRNHGQPEDRRYQQIRQRNQPHFEWKSVYLVFGLQAVLAWLVSLPLLAGARGSAALSALDLLGVAVFLFGFVFEAVADMQMARFKALPANAGHVMDRGLWRYSRHPNYFGECCVWWGLYLMAAAAGGWWSALSPLLMTVLLLKVSGVTLLEADIGERRPAYRQYIQRTNAFIPGPSRRTP